MTRKGLDPESMETKAIRTPSPFRIVWKDYELGLAKTVLLYPHSPKWAEAFDKFSQIFAETFPDIAIKFHHIGSTSIGGHGIQGIKSKPIIDILGEIPNLEAFDISKSRLEEVGLQWRGENGIPNRRFLKLQSWRGPETFFHLHVFEKGSEQLQSHLLFRDYLRAHPLVAHAYQEQKLRLQSLFHESRERYTDTKAAMIKDILAKARFWQESLSTSHV